MSRSPDGDDEPKKGSLSGWALLAAAAALLGFGAFVFYMITQVEAAEVRWTRLAWLFASVEAIAFGAAGALFGSSIQRGRAERAERAAAESSREAVRGRALAEALVADAEAAPPGGAAPAADERALSVVGRHAALARKLFP